MHKSPKSSEMVTKINVEKKYIAHFPTSVKKNECASHAPVCRLEQRLQNVHQVLLEIISGESFIFSISVGVQIAFLFVVFLGEYGLLLKQSNSKRTVLCKHASP